jgi:cysteine desulfurase
MAEPDPYYFDYAASEPPYPEALEEYVRFATKFSANPSSAHSSGIEARRALTEKKIAFCNLLGLKDGHLLLCGSATEANNTVIEGHRKRFPNGRILIAEDVHDSIWYATTKHSEHAEILSLKDLLNLPTDDPARILGGDTTLVCVTQVCNETGRIHRLDSLAQFCHLNHIKLLIDGSQAVGHIPVNLDQIPCDYYCFSAHKFGGPRGVGGLLMRDREFEPLLSGGKQEWELRAGTENPAGLAAAVKALEISLSNLEGQMVRLHRMKEDLLHQLSSEIPRMLTNTPDQSRPGLLSVSIPGMRGNEMISALSLHGIKAATGSACHADRSVPSRVILSTGRSEKEAIGTIRISMGRGNTAQTVDGLGKALLGMINDKA